MVFNEHEASTLRSLLMDYEDGTPEYDSAIRKLLAARDSSQDFTGNDLPLILDAIEKYAEDTAELLTPSYDSPPFTSLATASIVSERETIFRLRERICKALSTSQPES